MLNEALERLRAQAHANYMRPWYPGMQMSDAELLVEYIDAIVRDNVRLESIATEYNWVKNPDRMGR